MTQFVSPEVIAWIIAALIIFIGCGIQTALGFGMGLLAAPIIVMFKPEWVPVSLIFCALLLCVMNAWNQRDAVDMRLMIIPMIFRIPGTILGIWLLIYIDIFWFKILVASAVLIGVLGSYRISIFQPTPVNLSIAALLSGFLGTTTSIGGPTMALAMQFAEPRIARANLSLFFTYGCILSMIAYALSGILAYELIYIGASFLPFVYLGVHYGKKLRPFVDNGKFRPLLLSLCSLAALIVFAGAFISEE